MTTLLNSLNRNHAWRDLIRLSFLFVAIFTPLLVFFDIPTQHDDFEYSYQVNHLNLSLNEFYEYKRSIIPGLLLYKLYELTNLFKQSFATNAMWVIYLSAHFITGIATYFTVRKGVSLSSIKNRINVPFWVASLMMFQQPAIESFANGSFGIRLISVLFVILFFYVQLQQIMQPSTLKTIIACGLAYLSVAFYEVNAFFLMIGFYLPFLATNRFKQLGLKQMKRYLMQCSLSTLLPIMMIAPHMLTTLTGKSTASSIGIMNEIRRFAYYFGQHMVPNLGGGILAGTPLYAIAIAITIGLGFLMVLTCASFTKKRILLVLIHWIMFILILSLLPYFAPRLLITSAFIFNLMIILTLNYFYKVKPHGIRLILATLLATSIINILHFFVIQDTLHTTLSRIKTHIEYAEANNQCAIIHAVTNRPPVIGLLPQKEFDLAHFFNYALNTQLTCHVVKMEDTFWHLNTTHRMAKTVTSKFWGAFFIKDPYHLTTTYRPSPSRSK